MTNNDLIEKNKIV